MQGWWSFLEISTSLRTCSRQPCSVIFCLFMIFMATQQSDGRCLPILVFPNLEQEITLPRRRIGGQWSTDPVIADILDDVPSLFLLDVLHDCADHFVLPGDHYIIMETNIIENEAKIALLEDDFTLVCPKNALVTESIVPWEASPSRKRVKQPQQLPSIKKEQEQRNPRSIQRLLDKQNARQAFNASFVVNQTNEETESKRSSVCVYRSVESTTMSINSNRIMKLQKHNRQMRRKQQQKSGSMKQELLLFQDAEREGSPSQNYQSWLRVKKCKKHEKKAAGNGDLDLAASRMTQNVKQFLLSQYKLKEEDSKRKKQQAKMHSQEIKKRLDQPEIGYSDRVSLMKKDRRIKQTVSQSKKILFEDETSLLHQIYQEVESSKRSRVKAEVLSPEDSQIKKVNQNHHTNRHFFFGLDTNRFKKDLLLTNIKGYVQRQGSFDIKAAIQQPRKEPIQVMHLPDNSQISFT